MKPTGIKITPFDVILTGKCPNCEKELQYTTGHEDKVTCSCGQKINWNCDELVDKISKIEL